MNDNPFMLKSDHNAALERVQYRYDTHLRLIGQNNFIIGGIVGLFAGVTMTILCSIAMLP